MFGPLQVVLLLHSLHGLYLIVIDTSQRMPPLFPLVPSAGSTVRIGRALVNYWPVIDCNYGQRRVLAFSGIDPAGNRAERLHGSRSSATRSIIREVQALERN